MHFRWVRPNTFHTRHCCCCLLPDSVGIFIGRSSNRKMELTSPTLESHRREYPSHRGLIVKMYAFAQYLRLHGVYNGWSVWCCNASPTTTPVLSCWRWGKLNMCTLIATGTESTPLPNMASLGYSIGWLTLPISYLPSKLRKW